MAHIYMTFDFGTDEDKAQLARHKLDGWKQAFRLDKKVLYKFDRPAGPTGDAQEDDQPVKKDAKAEKPAKSGKTAKKASSKAKRETGDTGEAPAPVTGPVKLHVRLAFSGHEKMTEERWLQRIPAEEPFHAAGPRILKANDAGFAEIEGKFDSLE
jgi:hypothetical protein